MITSIQTGETYLIITLYNLSRANFSPFFVISLVTVFVPTIQPISKQVQNATIGIKILLEIKSKKVRKSIPRSLIFDQIPFPNEDGIPRRTATPNTMRIAGNLLILNLSVIIDTIASIREMELVIAAKNTRMKKSIPILYDANRI